MVRLRISAAIMLAVGGGVIVGLAPLCLKLLVDRFADGEPAAATFPYVAAYLSVLFVNRLVSQVQTYLFATGEQRFQEVLNAKAFGRLIHLPMEHHLRTPLGGMLRSHALMLQGVRLLLLHAVHTMLPVIAQLIAMVIVVATLFNATTWVGLASVAILYAVVFAGAARWQRHATANALAAETQASTFLADAIANIEPIKSAVAEVRTGNAYLRELRRGSDQWALANVRRMWTGVLIAVLYASGAGLIIWLATAGSGKAALSAGGLVLLLTYLAQILAPLEAAGFAFQDIAQVMRYFDGWRQIEAVSPEIVRADEAAPSTTSPAAPEVRFDAVTLVYGDGREALTSVSFKLEAGEVTALVGPSGAGKTSIARALLRFCNISSGEIFIDGAPCSAMDLGDLRSRVALISQDTVLFNETLRQNLVFAEPDIDTGRLHQVLDMLRLRSLIARLPRGLDTDVGERGQQLSGGERQRVGIARALLRDTPVLVLDEPTSALDRETEDAVAAVLFDDTHKRTTLLITHRPELAARARRILIIADGKIVEEGTHAQLLSIDGSYASLWRKRAANRTDRVADNGVS